MNRQVEKWQFKTMDIFPVYYFSESAAKFYLCYPLSLSYKYPLQSLPFKFNL